MSDYILYVHYELIREGCDSFYTDKNTMCVPFKTNKFVPLVYLEFDRYHSRNI